MFEADKFQYDEMVLPIAPDLFENPTMIPTTRQTEQPIFLPPPERTYAGIFVVEPPAVESEDGGTIADHVPAPCPYEPARKIEQDVLRPRKDGCL